MFFQIKDNLGEITIKEESVEETIVDESSSPDLDIENYPEHFAESGNYMVNPIELGDDLVEVYQPWDNDEIEIIPVESPKTVDLTDNENENQPKSPVLIQSINLPESEPTVDKTNELKRKSEDRQTINQNGGTESPVSKKTKTNSDTSNTNKPLSVQSQTDTECFGEASTVTKKIKNSESSVGFNTNKQSKTDFDSFGMFVADQLQRIPLNRALRAQLTITTILTELRVLSAEESASQMSSEDDK